MRHKIPSNPFPVSGYYGPKYFCDREEETQKILQLLQNGQSCILLGNRRLGKTALIQHIRGQLPKNWGSVYLDILSTENEQQFLNALGAALLQHFPEKSTLGKHTWDFVKSLRPTISFDPLTGIPQVSFHTTQSEKPVRDMLVFLGTLNQPLVIAIDEFQQIHAYPEQNTDGWLRATIQQLQNVTFLFSGSRQSILTEMFSDPARPFYKSASPLKLEKIDPDKYREFIVHTFASHGKSLSDELAAEMLDWAKTYTYYVQLLCNRLFQLQKNTYSQDDWHYCADNILVENEPFFIYYRTLLSPQQWKLLVAIAKTGRVYAPTSKDFISKNQLGSGATVFKSLDSLMAKELIYKEQDVGTGYYEVYDVFFERWIQRTY